MRQFNLKIFSTLFFSIFATVTGVGIVVPLLPFYAHHLGAGGLYIGLIFGAFSLSRTFFLPYFGRLSDKKGRRPFIIAGLFAYALISIAFLLSNSVESLIAIRLIQGVASAMILPVVQAYVGDITPEGREGFAMGLFNMSMFCGLSLGPLLGGVINDRFSLDAAFVSMGFLALVGFILSYFLLPPTASEQAVNRGRDPIAWKWLVADRNIAGLFLFRFAYTTCIGVIWGFLPVFASAEFSISSSAIGVLVMMGVLISGIIHAPMGYLADKMNKQVIVLAGGLLISYAVFSFKGARGFNDLMLSSIIFGIGGGISMPALMAIAVKVGNKTASMGSVMALLTVAHSLGMLFGSFMAGLMMDVFELRQAFFLAAVMMIAGTGFFMGFTSHRVQGVKDSRGRVKG